MAWPAWAGATESTPSDSLVNMNWSTGRSVPRGRRIYDEAVRQALIVAWEASDRICGKRLKGRPAQYGPVPGEARSSRPRSRPRRARTTILSERQYHGPGAQAGEGEGWKPQETKLASTEGHRWTA